MLLNRNQQSRRVTCTNDSGTSPEIPYADFAGGNIFIKNPTSISSVTFYAAQGVPGETNPDGTNLVNTYFQVYDKTNTAVSITVGAGRSYPIPDECFGAGSIKIVLNGVASEDVIVCLKG